MEEFVVRRKGEFLVIEIKIEGIPVWVKTHPRPHLDELAAIWLFITFANKEFLKKYAKYAPDNVLEIEIGVGGGFFDEHPVNGEKKEGECAATLMAKALGVDDNRALEKILKFVLITDLQGALHPFDLSSLVKLLHQEFPDNPEKVIEWTFTALDAKYQEQLHFFAAKEEFERVAEIEEIEGPGGQMVKMITIISDNEQMNKFARYSVSSRQSVVIIQRRSSSGHVQIYTNKGSRLNLSDIVRMIRLAEQKAEGQLVTTDWKTLEGEGRLHNWYFHPIGGFLLNGSLTAPDVPPTRLSVEEIKEIIKVGVNPKLFEPSRAPLCQRGICSSTHRNPCSWYDWGLSRCRRNRYMKNFLNSR